jgi:hypothetical protein
MRRHTRDAAETEWQSRVLYRFRSVSVIALRHRIMLMRAILVVS